MGYWWCMQILDTLVSSCPDLVSSRLAAKSWTHRFAHLAVTTTQASVRQAVLQLMANWAFQHVYATMLLAVLHSASTALVQAQAAASKIELVRGPKS